MIISRSIPNYRLIDFSVWCAQQEARIRMELTQREERYLRRQIAWESRYGWWSKDHTNKAA